MAAPAMFPPTKILRDMLLDMLSRDVTVSPSEPWAPTLRDPGAVGVYVDDGMRLRAVIGIDLPLSVALGASIALIPAKAAVACVEEGKLTSDMAENLNEVLNILSTFFNMADRPHVKLYALHVPGEPLSDDLSAHLRAFGMRQDLQIAVAGYGSGRMSLVLA